MITPTLPSAEYGIYVSEDKANNARLFVNRKSLAKYCKTFIPVNPCIAEIGVFQGCFSDFLIDTFTPSELNLIDTFNVNDHVTGKFQSNTHYDYIKNKYKNAPYVKQHQGLSWDVLETFPDDYFDYIYIDADHSYDAVQKDISVAHRKLKSTGIIQFNDYTLFGSHENAPYGVMYAVNEYIEQQNINIIGLSLERSGYHDLAIQKI